MTRPAKAPAFRPRLEALDERCNPDAGQFLLPMPNGSAPLDLTQIISRGIAPFSETNPQVAHQEQFTFPQRIKSAAQAALELPSWELPTFHRGLLFPTPRHDSMTYMLNSVNTSSQKTVSAAATASWQQNDFLFLGSLFQITGERTGVVAC